jgi:hypothetical protein
MTEKWRRVAERLARALQRLARLDDTNRQANDEVYEEALNALVDYAELRSEECE